MKGGRRAAFALLLALSLTFSGCISPEIQEWGSDGIEVDIDELTMNATISKDDVNIENQEYSMVGCNDENAIDIANNTNKTPVTIEGWLSASKHFNQEPGEVMGSESLAVSAAVIKLNRFNDAKLPDGGNINVKLSSWNTPNAPGLKASPPGSTSSSFPQQGWGVVGLIPGNEEVLEGFHGLEWHQEIAIKGWFLEEIPDDIVYSSKDECRIISGGYPTSNAGFSGTLLVTEIKLGNHGLINEENSYSSYSVPFIGGWLYSTSILFSIGGSVLLFFAISGIIRRGATLSARELMTETQMIAARGVKKEVRKAEGTIQKERAEFEKTKTKIEKPDVDVEKTSVELDDFDIDSAIYGAHRPSARSVTSGTSGGVIVTDEAKEMQDDLGEIEEINVVEDLNEEGVTVPSRGYKPENTIIPSNVSEPKPVPRKVRKTRTVKQKQKAETAPEPKTRNEKSGPDINDDEEFSDFSF